MRIAFYAPLKPPDHGQPSGDRRIAQLLWQALRQGGHDVVLAAHYRSREAHGDELRQRRLRATGERLAARLVRRYLRVTEAERPEVWFTYHLYYKAPDWLGPIVSSALGIPYVVAEASYAPKRDCAPWQMVHRAVGAAIAKADAVIALNPDDVACVMPLRQGFRGATPVHFLPPFLDAHAFVPQASKATLRGRLAHEFNLDPAATWLTSVAMMRPGDKLASYTMLAAALRELPEQNWQLLIVGDGETRAEVESLMANVPGDRIRFVGLQQSSRLAETLCACDLYVWPAVNEAFGMAFLEAQVCGLPVVAGATRGVPAVVADGVTGTLTPLTPAAIAAALRALIQAPAQRARYGMAAASYVRRQHDIDAGAAALNAILADLRVDARW